MYICILCIYIYTYKENESYSTLQFLAFLIEQTSLCVAHGTYLYSIIPLVNENLSRPLFVSVGGMNRQNSKTAPVIKKVAPPTVPDFRHSGSSFGSAGYSSSGEDTFSISAAPVDVNKGNRNTFPPLFQCPEHTNTRFALLADTFNRSPLFIHNTHSDMTWQTILRTTRSTDIIFDKITYLLTNKNRSFHVS